MHGHCPHCNKQIIQIFFLPYLQFAYSSVVHVGNLSTVVYFKLSLIHSFLILFFLYLNNFGVVEFGAFLLFWFQFYLWFLFLNKGEGKICMNSNFICNY